MLCGRFRYQQSVLSFNHHSDPLAYIVYISKPIESLCLDLGWIEPERGETGTELNT